MIVTCPQCQAAYNLDPNKLGEDGRTVRCTTCLHMWTQRSSETPSPAPATSDISFDDVPPPAESFEATLQKIEDAPTSPSPPPPKMPDVLKPKPLDFSMPNPITYKVMGMGPKQFGALTFLACFFVSAIFLFSFKTGLTQTWPALSAFYRVLGFELHVPGEGLRFGALSVENRISGDKKTLVLVTSLSNISDKEKPYPPMRVTLKSASGAILKEWHLNSDDRKPLASGESVPVKSEWDDAPEGGDSVEIEVATP